MNYLEKYHKYKIKYLELKNNQMIGGSINDGDKIKHIYLIRHGETEWNAKGLSQGKENDIELNSNGKSQAKITGKYLSKIASRENFDFDLILSSPMARTLETAEIIGNEIGYKDKIITNENLVENGTGLLSVGKTHEEMSQDKFYDDFFSEMDTWNNLDIVERNQIEEMPKIFMGKYKVESMDERKQRALDIIRLLNQIDKQRIIVVSHNGFIDVINKIILNTNDVIRGDLSNGKNCHLTYYQINKSDNRWKLICAPNTLHLK